MSDNTPLPAENPARKPKSPLYAGAAAMEISPPAGIELAGYPHQPRHNTGIHDPLWISCLCLESAGARLAILCADLLFLSKKYVGEIRRRIEEATGIPGRNILASCTHTHSAPWTSGRLDLEALEKGLDVDAAYVAQCMDRAVEAAIRAHARRAPALLGTGMALCGVREGIGGNRRNPAGPADPQVMVLAVRDAEGGSGAVKAVLVNYALHPTVLHADNTLVSGDYPAYVRKYLETRYPGAVVLFAQGFSGNQSTRYFRSAQTFGEAARIGTILGKAAESAVESLAWQESSVLEAYSEDSRFIYRKLPPLGEAEAAVSAASARVQALRDAGASPLEIWNSELIFYGAEDLLAYARLTARGELPALAVDETPPELQVLRLGDGVLAAVPGEWFVEYALDLKARSPFPWTACVALANGGTPGYVYTREALADGGYETDTSMLAPETGEQMMEQVWNMLASIRR